MNNNYKFDPMDKINLVDKIPSQVLDTKRRHTPAMGPRPHDQNKSNPMVVVDSKGTTTQVSGSVSRGQKTDKMLVLDSKMQPETSLGPLPHDQKINPTVVEDIKIRPRPTQIGHRLHEQKIGLLVGDSNTRPMAHNLGAILSQPFIRITQPNKEKMTPLPGKHGFKTCICWTIGLIFLLLIILGATVCIIYIVFRPKIPIYSVDSLSISDLRLNLDLSLYAKFDVKITATNPNKNIGIYYRKGSKLSVWYSDTKLCQGSLPKFYQGHQNRTKLDVALTGQNQYGSTLMEALQEQQQTGRIPLNLKVDVPVNIKVGNLKLRKIRILGTCLLTVDSLSANSFITIKASTCKFGAKL